MGTRNWGIFILGVGFIVLGIFSFGCAFFANTSAIANFLMGMGIAFVLLGLMIIQDSKIGEERDDEKSISGRG